MHLIYYVPILKEIEIYVCYMGIYASSLVYVKSDISRRKNNYRKIYSAHYMITKRDFILCGSCFCEKYSKLIQLHMILGSDRNFGSVRFGVRLILAGSVRQKFAEFFVIQFHAHLQYTGIKRTDYAILCNKSFSQPQQNFTIHISTTPFYVVKLSACCGEGFYIHALIL